MEFSKEEFEVIDEDGNIHKTTNVTKTSGNILENLFFGSCFLTVFVFFILVGAAILGSLWKLNVWLWAV